MVRASSCNRQSVASTSALATLSRARLDQRAFARGAFDDRHRQAGDADQPLALINPELLKREGVDAVNVPDGPRAQSRMGAVMTSLLIEQQVGIETVTHYCCRDRNLLGMLSDLLGASAMGLRRSVSERSTTAP